jgi:hypothetical protein
MISDLASGATSSSGPLASLQSDFQNLVTAMGGASSASGSAAGSTAGGSGGGSTGTSATLQNFLANLEQQMAGHQMNPSAVGNNVSTQV